MKTNSVIEFAHKRLVSYYQHRTERLKTLKLNDILPWIPRNLNLLGANLASTIVTEMIENYLASSELELNDSVTNAEFCIELIRQKNELTNICWEYEMQFAHAQNIITHEFCKKFLTRGRNVDWKKLLRFSSGIKAEALAKT